MSTKVELLYGNISLEDLAKMDMFRTAVSDQPSFGPRLKEMLGRTYYTVLWN